MKSLSNYIKSDKSSLISLTEKLVINKNYTDIYNYHPKDKNELKAAIQEHYDNGIYDLNDIDVSNITDFSYVFNSDKNTANEKFDISNWNVSNGKNFRTMFYDCKKFNCNLSNWDVNNGTDFMSMFSNCEEFNCNLNNWNVSKCENFLYMFKNCYLFNSDLSNWNVSNGKDFSLMFYRCKNFNHDLSGWKINKIARTDGMFLHCNIDDKYKPKRVQ